MWSKGDIGSKDLPPCSLLDQWLENTLKWRNVAFVSQQYPPSPETLVSQSAHATETQWVKNETERVTHPRWKQLRPTSLRPPEMLPRFIWLRLPLFLHFFCLCLPPPLSLFVRDITIKIMLEIHIHSIMSNELHLRPFGKSDIWRKRITMLSVWPWTWDPSASVK